MPELTSQQKSLMSSQTQGELDALDREAIQQVIAERDLWRLRRLVNALDPVHLSALMSELPAEDDVVVFRLLSPSLATRTFEVLPHERQEGLIHALAEKRERLADLLNDLSPDDRTDLLEELPGPLAQRLIQLLSPAERDVATMLLGYPEDSIGRLMTTDYIAVTPDLSVADTLAYIRRHGHDSETLNVIYVIDARGRLVDDLRIREVLLAEPDSLISDIVDGHYVVLKASDDQEKAIQVFRDYDRFALPVTDHEGILIGIVTADDILDVAQEEATEDFHKFGSLQHGVYNPLKVSSVFLFRKRVLWLLILVFMNLFSGAAIAAYESTIQSMVALLFFLPMLIATGGNAGSQSATLMVRALATGDVLVSDWLLMLGKETLVALLLGGVLGLSVALVAQIHTPDLVLVVTLSMFSVVIVGSLVGLILPFLFTRAGLDPATACAPLITSVADISGVVIYFAIATWYLGQLS